MTDASSRTVLLWNFTGYPDYTSYFLADSGLAYLAAKLKLSGHRCVIRDDLTLDMAERLYPYEHAPRVLELRDLITHEIIREGRISDRTLGEAREIDAQVEERNGRIAAEIARELEATIAQERVDVLAVKLWTQPSLHHVSSVLRHLRHRFPHLPIIGGGGHVDYFTTRVLDTIPTLDAAAYGDGEMAFLGYMRFLSGEIPLEQVPNLIYRLNGTTRMNSAVANAQFKDEVVCQDFEPDTYLAMNSEYLKMKTIPLEDSRGCQFSCGFCAHPIKSGMLRLRNVEVVLDEIAHLNRRYGLLHFTGSGSNTPFYHASRIYRGLKDRRLDVALNFFQSTRDFQLEKADIMLESNIPLFWIGLETAAEGLLDDSLDKKRSMPKTRQVCEFLNRARIGYIMSVIYPVLGETEETKQKTIDFIREVSEGHLVIYPPLVQPRTPWMVSPHVQWLDEELFLGRSQYGLEEVENRVLPPIVADEELNRSVLLNGKTYREIYCDTVRFRDEMNQLYAGKRGYQRDFPATPHLEPFIRQLNETFYTVDKSLSNGRFDEARQSMAEFNKLATAGSITATRSLFSVVQGIGPLVQQRSGGPA